MPPAEPKERFTLGEARLLMPEVRRLTREAVAAVERIQEALVAKADPTPDDVAVAERSLQAVVGDWAAAIHRLGAEVKGLWLVDFDNGAGYFCWQHPEPELCHFHDYEAGFAGRTPIQ